MMALLMIYDFKF